MREYLTGFVGYVSDKSKSTISCYRRDLEKYIAFLEKNGIKSFSLATKTTILTYLLSLSAEGFSDATIRRTLSSLKALYNYLSVENPDIKNPTVNIEPPSRVKTAPKILSWEQVEKFLSAPDIKTSKGRRDRAMMEVLYATGIKVSELINLDLGDVNTAAGYLRCKGGKRERVLPMGQLASEAVMRYITSSRKSFLERSMPLLISLVFLQSKSFSAA